MEDLTNAVTDAPADSSTDASTATDQTAQAPQTPVDPHAGKPFHQHPRWIERETQWRQREGQMTQYIGQLTQRLQALEAAQQQGASTPSDAQDLAQAVNGLKRILNADPELKAWFESRGDMDSLREGYQGVQALTQQSNAQRIESARQYIGGLAKTAGLQFDPKHADRIIDMVATAAIRLPGGNDRFRRGDLTVLDEAFEQIKEFVGLLRKEPVAQTAQVKARTRNLPPAPRGGQAGEPAEPKPTPGKERDFVKNLHARGRAMLQDLTKE